MSIATEITRIQTARNTIRAKLVELGMAQNTDGLDDLAVAVKAVENQGAVSATIQEGDTYTIPKGYHNGSGTVSGVAGGGEGGTTDHRLLAHRDAEEQHPISSISGLKNELERIPEPVEPLTNQDLEAILK